jgi:RNA polymerase sigma-70 factor (ECF subfamily)
MTMPVDPLRDPEPLIRRIYSYVAFRIGDGAEAEDVTSEVFERALRYRSSYDPRRGEPVSWLIGIARRCIDDAFRVSNSGAGADVGVADSGDLEADALRRVAVARALGRLAQRDGELLALRYGADLQNRAIASLLEMTPEAIDVALHRARQRLREELIREGEPLGVSPVDRPASGPAHV